ncbi:hypothetical protein [Pseudoalteromonas spongiae]|uniref:hypothetical protein n=1 Tax=Pseudoalteromonas spongiae TaxID=298657 RepID=UPI00110A684B|nr:hypothetical protein [Pseudoalteromonas spongiae]TMO82779.1 hypothetical protein CWC15_17980 [Pseudoalteromonas spongiae]
MKGLIKQKLTVLAGVFAKAFKVAGDLVIIVGALGDLNNDLRVIYLKDAVLVSLCLYTLALALYVLDMRLNPDA